LVCGTGLVSLKATTIPAARSAAAVGLVAFLIELAPSVRTMMRPGESEWRVYGVGCRGGRPERG